LIASHFGTRMRKEESDPRNKSANGHEHTLSHVTKWLKWFWYLERFCSIELCLGLNALALVVNENFRKLGCLELWWLGGIYSPQPPNGRWGRLLAMGALDSPVHHRTDTVGCPVRRHVTQPLGFGSSRPLASLSSCGTGQILFIVRCASDSAALTLRALFLCQRLLQSTVAQVSRCSAGAPDSPVAHRTVWWIIAECACENPRVAGWTQYGSGAPDSPVR
jgi:hypothetical protein